MRHIISLVLFIISLYVPAWTQTNKNLAIYIIDRRDNPPTMELNKDLLQALKCLREKSQLSKTQLPIVVLHRDLVDHFVFSNKHFQITDDVLPVIILSQISYNGNPSTIFFKRTSVVTPFQDAEQLFQTIRQITGNSKIATSLPTSLHVISDPSGASININDKERGITPLNIEVTPGSYKITVSYPDMQIIERTVNLSYSEAKEENFKLEPVISQNNIRLNFDNKKDDEKIEKNIPTKQRITILAKVYESGYYEQKTSKYVNFKHDEMLKYVRNKLADTGIFEVVYDYPTQYEVTFNVTSSSEWVKCRLELKKQSTLVFEDVQKVSMPIVPSFLAGFYDSNSIVTKRAKNLIDNLIQIIIEKVSK